MADTNTHWRDSARTPRFFIMDAYAFFPILFFMLHIRLWTFLLSLGFMAFFILLERFKFTIPVFARWVRASIAGSLRVAKPWSKT